MSEKVAVNGLDDWSWRKLDSKLVSFEIGTALPSITSFPAEEELSELTVK